MSKKKSKKKVDIRSSILVLLLIAILLIASTYAWFTANTKVTISSLDVHVDAQNGIQISADGTTWKTVLQNEDILPANVTAKYAGNVNQIPTNMEPVSTTGNVNEGKMDMFYGTVAADATGTWKLTATKETDKQGTEGKYIAFDMFLKIDQDKTLTLTENSNVVFNSKLQEKTTGLENEARVAFVELGHVDTGTDLKTIQGLKAGTTTYIWEPNYDVHTKDGKQAAFDTYGITTTETGGSIIPYNGIKAAIDAGNAQLLNSNDTNYFAPVTPTYSTKQAREDTEVFALKAGITKFRVYMWIEGQDVDCENNASGSDISFNVQFSIPTI